MSPRSVEHILMITDMTADINEDKLIMTIHREHHVQSTGGLNDARRESIVVGLQSLRFDIKTAL